MPNFFNNQTEEIKTRLSLAEITEFQKKGWIGPFSLLHRESIDSLTELFNSKRDSFVSGQEIQHFTKGDHFNEKPWFKSVHAYIPEFYDVLKDTKIVSKVSSILGNDIILWGTSVTVRKPSQIHRWHIDVEHQRWKGISVFIGLKGTTPQSSLKVVSGSHKILQRPVFRDLNTDEDVLREARKTDSDAEVQVINVNEGEFFLFDGLLWHGSENQTQLTRHAIIAQYTMPGNKVEIPLNWDEPINWSLYSPPCYLISGKDNYNVNKNTL